MSKSYAVTFFTLLIFASSAIFYDLRAADTETPSGEHVDKVINSAKQIGSGIVEGGSNLVSNLPDIDLKAPASVWSSVDGWFFETTGTHVVDMFKAVGHFIVWFLELVLSLFKWILALVE